MSRAIKPIEQQSLVELLLNRATIRRQIPSRKSVQEGTPDRLADLLEQAADHIMHLETDVVYYREYIRNCWATTHLPRTTVTTIAVDCIEQHHPSGAVWTLPLSVLDCEAVFASDRTFDSYVSNNPRTPFVFIKRPNLYFIKPRDAGQLMQAVVSYYQSHSNLGFVKIDPISPDEFSLSGEGRAEL